MINKGLFSSNSEEWATPIKLFEELNEEFNFTLDPCANADNAKCRNFFTKEQDGLLQSWGGTPCFAIPRTESNSLCGWKRHTKKAPSERRLFCLSPRERILDIFTILSTKSTRYGLFEVACILTKASNPRRSPL